MIDGLAYAKSLASAHRRATLPSGGSAPHHLDPSGCRASPATWSLTG